MIRRDVQIIPVISILSINGIVTGDEGFVYIIIRKMPIRPPHHDVVLLGSGTRRARQNHQPEHHGRSFRHAAQSYTRQGGLIATSTQLFRPEDDQSGIPGIPGASHCQGGVGECQPDQ